LNGINKSESAFYQLKKALMTFPSLVSWFRGRVVVPVGRKKRWGKGMGG
jgi:hypothetical protein